jgi:hypothetical protein
MATIKISPQQWTLYLTMLGNNYMPTVMRGILAGALRCVPIMQERTDNAPPASDGGSMGAVNYGMYRMSWKAVCVPEGARLYNDRPYAGVIEYGRRAKYPGKEGVRALQVWAKRKFKLSDEESLPVARAIAWNMKSRALRPRGVMMGLPPPSGLQKLATVVLDEVQRELDLELNK